jgi:YVTN family beta-propeller protein
LGALARLARNRVSTGLALLACVLLVRAAATGAATGTLPDGRPLTPEGFTVPVEGFASAAALSPDARYLAVLSQDAGAIDVISTERSALVERLRTPSATGLAWTSDGLYVSRGYTGSVARFTYIASLKQDEPHFTARPELQLGPGLLSGIAEDPATHRLAVARTAAREVVVVDDVTGTAVRLAAPGEPFGVAFAGETLVATLYNERRVAFWARASGEARLVVTGPHPTALLAAGPRVYVADADGHDVVALDPLTATVTRNYELGLGQNPPPGQTPSGMALSTDGRTLFVCESGFNDVALVDVASGRVRARVPAGWYPMAVAYVARAIGGKDARIKEQLWIANAQGLGSQPDPGGEWNGTYTGLVQHVVLEPARYAAWSAIVTRNDGLSRPERAADARAALPPIRHVVFIVRENKQFDEEFGDEPQADGDPALVLYGRRYTPNAHALAERYTLFDDFMGNGEASIYGHSWTTQGLANDYQERNAHARDEDTPGIAARVPWSIWPYPEAGEDALTQAAMDFDWFQDLDRLASGPRMNVSAVFGPRGELVDECARKGISFRVYGEQLTMGDDGRIALPLAANAARDYPGAHIDFDVLDTDRAALFINDVRAHGLPQYAYLTLPTDHTAGTKAGFYTPASYVANNDVALGTIVAALSKRPDWRETVVFVTTDDPQGTGDHVDAHRMPAFLVGPYARRGFVDHTHYSIPSFLKTVETLFGLAPLNIEDAAATPMSDAFAKEPLLAAFAPLPSAIAMERNPGKAASYEMPLDGPDAGRIAAQEWASLRGPRAVARAGRVVRTNRS